MALVRIVPEITALATASEAAPGRSGPYSLESNIGSVYGAVLRAQRQCRTRCCTIWVQKDPDYSMTGDCWPPRGHGAQQGRGLGRAGRAGLSVNSGNTPRNSREITVKRNRFGLRVVPVGRARPRGLFSFIGFSFVLLLLSLGPSPFLFTLIHIVRQIPHGLTAARTGGLHLEGPLIAAAAAWSKALGWE